MTDSRAMQPKQGAESRSVSQNRNNCRGRACPCPLIIEINAGRDKPCPYSFVRRLISESGAAIQTRGKASVSSVMATAVTSARRLMRRDVARS